MRGLYIHIPFCKHICNYCDFHKMVTFNETRIDEYIDVLISEIDSYKKYLNDEIKTIYIGGGTPNVLSDYNLERLLSYINSLNLNVLEYTIEINPELLTLNQVLLFKKYNISRVSIGAESFDDKALEILGRHHKASDIYDSVHLLKKYGISNINIDLMFGIPNDTIESIKHNLNCCKELEIPHISYYSLILEEKTIFYKKWIKGDFKPLDEDTLADMMNYINKELENSGFNHYEISNYAKENYESIHNKVYWENLEYIGVGSGASGYLNGVRYDNHYNLSKYKSKYRSIETLLSLEDKREEFMILGLRMKKGIDINEYNKRYGSSPLIDFNLEKVINQGLLIKENNILRLSYRGYMLSNLVLEEFIR